MDTGVNMKLNRRQLRSLLLREVRILSEKKGESAAAQKEAEEQFGEDGKKAVGVGKLMNDVNMARRLAEQKCKMKGGKSGKKIEQMKHDGATYIVCIMNK
tara:strand:+ start:5081 stop:5380 length:300 start_codon:yes stop_codon:yes gene_type:complete